MSKPTSSFNLSAPTKALMATITDPVARSEFKNAMIQAEIAKAIRPKSNKADREAAK
jgi:hypothetical protein